MRKIILSLLIAICPLASAEWVNAGPSEDGTFSVYIDNNSIRRNGSIIRVSWIKNYPSVQSTRRGKKYQSVHLINVYDCKAELSKLSSIAFHSEPMGAGEAVISAVYEEAQFTQILSSNEDTLVWQFVCKNTNKEGGSPSQKSKLPPNEGGGQKLVKLFVAGPDEGNVAGATIYFNQKSLAGNLTNKNFALVVDYPDPLAVEKSMMRSAVMKMEMNCGESLIRLVKIELMSDKVGNGDLIKVIEGDSWRKIPDNFYMRPDLVCVK